MGRALFIVFLGMALAIRPSRLLVVSAAEPNKKSEAATRSSKDSGVVQSWEDEYAAIQAELARYAKTSSVERQVARTHVLDVQSLVWESDRNPLDVVLRRTAALIDCLGSMPKAPDLAGARQELATIRDVARTVAPNKEPETVRRDLFLQTCALRRTVALSNPLLDFDEIIFSKGGGYGGLLHTTPWGEIAPVTKRKWTKDDWHTFDFSASQDETGPTGGSNVGLCALADYKTGTPRVCPLLAEAVLQNGRFKGAKVCAFPGAYHFAFDLSYDTKTVVFAKRLTGKGPYHLFSASVDGSGVTQLTSSWFPDWEPCILPNDRIVFVSLRRWTCARCQSWAPQACGTLFSMKADGSDLYPISWHETIEFFPTVNNDGMLAFTRWDYIDRDFNAGQHLWISYPDGRDPRAPHANYPKPHSTLESPGQSYDFRRNRPWAEFHSRAIPGTTSKYVSIAGIHHGSTPGVPIVIDLGVRDDDGMSQVKFIKGSRLPYEGIPGGEGRRFSGENMDDAKFITPWPLSEDFYLATFFHKTGPQIVLLDKFGNMEVLASGWKAGGSARPFKSRAVPPNIPLGTWQGERSSLASHRRATISVMNVYESDLPWPPATKITALRIMALVQKPWCSPVHHHATMGYSSGTLPRLVLGTVPVEEDGSAFFEAPVGQEIFLQALDQEGLAIQSMRSGTFVHPGEQLSCVGCHVDKWTAPKLTGAPIAMRRPPSVIKPDVDGSCPLTFARLVQPVIQNTCLPCHAKEKKGLRRMEYKDLRAYAFYFDASGDYFGLLPKHGGYRTIPGRFGARESPLGKTLLSTHRKRVTPEELHRITLWLDCNSQELGVYHDDQEQREGKVVWPVIESDPKNPTAVESAFPYP
ncbi:MAG: hypothetical protein ABR915_12850 [Thermoguttaceae bacterium]